MKLQKTLKLLVGNLPHGFGAVQPAVTSMQVAGS